MAESPNEWNRLLTPESLSEYGGTSFNAPEGSFDPSGTWTQTWQIWLLKRSARDVNHRGFIRLDRKPAAGGDSFKLEVKQAAIQKSQGAVHEIEATIRCANDMLSTPIEWSIRTRLYSAREGREIPMAAVNKRSSRKSMNVSGPASSSWSILDAIQRVGDRPETSTFVLLDELDKPKPGYRLTSARQARIPFGDGSVAVERYHLIGRGLLPTVFHVDHNRRLLLVLSGLRAYILNPEAEQIHEQEISKLSKTQE